MVAVCDPIPERVSEAMALHRGAQGYPSLAEVPANLDIQAALISTPAAGHLEVALCAFSRGLDALVEKPLALDVREAAAIVSAARRAGVHLSVGYNRRFRRNLRELQRRYRTASGSGLGPIEIRHDWTVDVARWHVADPAGGELALAAGLLHDVGSHQVDLLAWLTGEPVMEVKAMAGRREGTMRCELQHRGDLRSSFHTRLGARHRERLRVQTPGLVLSAGQGGLVVVPRSIVFLLDVPERVLDLGHLALSRAMHRPSMTGESYEKQLAAFAAAVRRRRDCTVADVDEVQRPELAAGSVDGLRAVAVVEACVRSLESGKTERVTADREIGLSPGPAG